MKLDGRMHTSDIRLKIDRLLRDVGLIERRDTRIGGGDDGKVLSGGEKKKLAFTTEVRIHVLDGSGQRLMQIPGFLLVVDGS